MKIENPFNKDIAYTTIIIVLIAALQFLTKGDQYEMLLLVGAILMYSVILYPVLLLVYEIFYFIGKIAGNVNLLSMNNFLNIHSWNKTTKK